MNSSYSPKIVRYLENNPPKNILSLLYQIIPFRARPNREAKYGQILYMNMRHILKNLVYPFHI